MITPATVGEKLQFNPITLKVHRTSSYIKIKQAKISLNYF